ncbi:MAG: diguanylate cyclase [Gaiellales bacterium]|nr:MAG: diguanylate cyclase [Gaiellales bacterium]
MERFSLEDFLHDDDEQTSPGTQLYLYRILNLLASGGTGASSQTAVSYNGSKKLAVRLGIDSAEKLAGLFHDLGLGEISVSLKQDSIAVTLTHRHIPRKVPHGQGPACELERGIVDGALEMMTGLAVTTSETSCWTKGSDTCTFEAFLDITDNQERFIPGPGRAHPSLTPSHGLGFSPMNQGGIRSWYLDLAARELARSRRHGRPLSIVYLDLDDLGRVNAEHGRKAGDQIISAVSAALSRACRAEDFLWHNGEDEFALVLSETDTDAADIVARRLSTAVLSAAENIEFAARISASIGYSTFPAHAEDLDSLLQSARSAQYLAKARGKGRTQVAVGTPDGDSARAQHGLASDDRSFTPRRSMTAPEGEAEPADADLQGKSISFVIAMSGPLLMAGLRQILSGKKEFLTLEEIEDPAKLADAIEDNRPDIVFSDMAMALSGDCAALRLIREENLPCKFVVFADAVDQEVIKVASDFNIDGIVLQSSSPGEIISVINSTYEGKTVIPDEAKSAIRELESQRQLLNELSERELEVLKLVAEGKSNSQIAQDLYITVNTVRFHLANVYQKLSVSNRTEAANCYLRQDVDTDSQTRLL